MNFLGGEGLRTKPTMWRIMWTAGLLKTDPDAAHANALRRIRK